MIKLFFDSKEMTTLENPVYQKYFARFGKWTIVNMDTVQMNKLE